MRHGQNHINFVKLKICYYNENEKILRRIYWNRNVESVIKIEKEQYRELRSQPLLFWEVFLVIISWNSQRFFQHS